ncbi:PREDICTED: dynein beta chain, flagellar outer arm-like [Nanorana parkeri]|uniref:dynein beta chain, flagellar outer arm-like n=1 Tax=Nanorana parkeri TaxID=125878 RepID=UPI0008545668|nr:PREDICTED: dynein beta chain, flagellar outer arm-like [Nanorana parkeri]
MDELLLWLEVRITSSLRPRAEEMKNLLSDHSYRSCLFEFLKNEDIHTLYIYFKLDKASLSATLSPPHVLQNKCLCFLKLGTAIKLTAENIADHVISVDCDKLPLKYFDGLLHQVYLPLLSNNNATGGTYSNDKIIDVLHRFTGSLEVIAGHAQGSIVLPIPSLELLKNTSLFNKHGAAIHILETSVIGWIKQIKDVLKHEPLAEIKAKGVMAGIYQEKEMWEMHIHNLESISLQLNSAEAREIVYHLEQAKSTYGKSISSVTNDVQKARHQTEENLMFLKTMVECYDQLKSARPHLEKQKCFFQLLHHLLFVWKHSRYYHQSKVFVNLLRLLSNEVVQIACGLLGNNFLHNSQAYSLLKEALKICATFRGNYLDVKIKADEFSMMKMEENATLTKSKKASETVCNVTMYEVPAPWVYGRDPYMNDKNQKDEEDAIWEESPWPLYNAPCFQNMNKFMERCNDVLDLVETMKHFEVLKAVTAIGGAGTSSLDAMVQDIWNSYCLAKDSFISQIKDIFIIDKNNPFQKAFFDLRTTVKSLEHQLGNILRSSFDQCPTIASQLRLLEVFEGVSRRDIVKDHLKEKDLQLYTMFMEELHQVKEMYLEMANNPPLHVNLTPTVSKCLWIKGLRARISGPMVNLKKVSPTTLEGDMGWELRHIYNEISQELERFEISVVTSWVSAVNKEISDSLKLPLLKPASLHDSGVFLHTLEINLNSDLLVYLREAEYFSKPPFTIKLPESVVSLVSNMETNKLKMLCTRLETVASKYNEVMKSISPHQMALFEKKLLKISEILRDGMSLFTWSMDESTDYIEFATSYICTDLYNSYSIVTNNYKLISELTASWCTANLDIFTCRDSSRSYSITELMIKQKEMEYDLESLLVSDGHRIHSLVQQSFVACGISEASPAWQEFIMHIDAIILQGLKKLTISSLAALLNTLLDHEHIAVLNIDVELINGEVAFNPPLDRSTSDTSVMEDIEEWLKMFLLRGSHVQGLSSTVKEGYQEYVSKDSEALQLIGLIIQQAESGILECQALLQGFRSYSYLWKKDINVEFQNFLCGEQTVGRTPEKNSNPLIVAERAFILPRDFSVHMMHGPLLDDFDSEISASKAVRDSIQGLPDHQQCRWIHVDFRPVKQVLSAYALKWMWTFTKCLIDQTSATLRNLDSFLRRTEPRIESITGEERDTGSFMKMMRLFNEVSSKQAEMEVQFAILQKTESLLGKHDMTLPSECEVLYKTMPARWNTMKTKVSLAKQRLGPRIQQEADIVSKDLEMFQHKLDTLGSDLENSEVYKYECTAQEAFGIIEEFNMHLEVLQKEAKDLKELQELLETTVVDFSILNNCGELLQNLSLVWQHVDSICKEQDIWKKELWHDMDTGELQQRTRQQQANLQSLPREVQEWDVYRQVLEAVNVMNLTLPLIEDLSNPAMRTRHWKQLVRQTGGMLRVTAESLKAMTLGDLLAMDLQKHTGDVRMTVQRAMRDLTIESSLKNCEEVWLSRIFDLGPHSRVISARAENAELESSVSGSHYTKGDMGRNLTTGKGSRRLSKQSDRGFHLTKKAGRGSSVSLYESLKHIEDFGKIQLLRNKESVFEELEHHQLLLTSIQPYAEAGSFLDDVTKWQKKLQVIETTVQLWLSVQDKWTQLEEVFSTLAFRVAMPREAILFADVHHHYCRLMKSVEENPNILQNCMRRGLQSLLDMLNYKLERCQHAVRLHLEQKKQAFPRLFFLSLEETLNIVCYGYDLKVLSSYIVKMFHHVHSLIYQFNSEHECNEILGVRSFLGEELYLTKPLECSGPVENWLPQLVNSIKASLQHHLWAAMEHSSTVITRRKEIHSAGARRVLINKTFSVGETAADERSIVSMAAEDVGKKRSRHWVLSTLSDVAYLSTQIKFCREYNGKSEQRNETMQGCLKDLTEGIEYAAKILNEIPQEDIQLHSKRSSKAERKGNGQDEGDVFKNQQDVNPLTPKPMLSAEDIVKLTNHILLLLYQRDVTSQILSGTAPLWKQNQPLCYGFDDSTKEIVVKIGDSEVQYGYEYHGSAKHILLTPLTEQIFLSVMGAVSAGTDALCAGPQASGKKSTIRELSLAVGKPLFYFNCSNALDNGILQDICKGLAAAGAWVCLNGLEQLSQPRLSLITQMLTQIQTAKHLGKETVTLHLEDIPLNTTGLCIAIIKRSPIGPEPYKLPDSLLNCFRIVGVRKCSINYILEAQLLFRGFSHVAYLAKKLSTILESFAKLHTADLLGSGSSKNGKFSGSSVKELNSLLDEASNILQFLLKKRSECQEQEENADEDWKQWLEDQAIVRAIYNCWLPQLSKDREHAFKTFLKAEWPNVFSSVNGLYDSGTDLNNLDGPFPTVIAAKYGSGQQVPSSECMGETSVPSAIIKAAEKCHIFPSNTFVSKVSHLVQLAPKYQTVLVTGPAGCGKTTCIKTFVEKLKDEGKKIKIDMVYTEALQSGQLLGFMNKSHRWVDGLLPQLLRVYCQPSTVTDHNQANILHLDGEVNGYEIELMQNLFPGAEYFTFQNNECIRISESLLIFWELDTLANVSPSILSCMGILVMTSDDIDCKLPLKMWMTTQEEEHQPLLHQLTKTFLEPCLQFLRNKHILNPQGQREERKRQHRELFLCEASVVQTFCKIAKALMVHVPDMLGEDMKKYFIFSCIWSFGGWLDSGERTKFSNWWRHTYRNHTTFPTEGEVWDYHIDTDTRHFVRWHDTLSSYSVSHGQNMASEAFAHTLHSEQLLYLSSLLTTSGCPVLLAGDTGCGKSVLSHELLNALCLGDVAEMSELRIPINSSTDPRRLWGCLKDRLEWRHGTLHTPAGNKKLLCLLDDLNLAKTNKRGSQPACEFIRQLLDQERIFDPLSLNWKTIKGIIYLATWNTAAPEISLAQRQRLLRHFCIFHCKYPSQNEQFGIFSSILNAHFVPGVTEHKGGSSGYMPAEHLKGLIAEITKVSIELHKRLRTVFLGTSQRCHYIFTLRDLAKIFRNICLSLDGRTTADKFLRLWRHECNWVYGHRMSSAVDYNRYVQELTIASQKELMNEEEVQIIVGPQQPLFSNIVEDEGGLISTVARQQDVNLFRRSEKASNSSTHILDGYQETFDSVHVKQLLTEALREYNKVNPRMNITFYQSTIDLVCRLSRNLWSPHGSAHTLLCGEGCPRSTSTVTRLAAHLSGFVVIQLGSHMKIEDEEQRARNLKSQLVDCYVKAGLKGQRTMLLLTEEDIDPTALVYIAEFVVFGSVSHLFTLEQQATIAHAMRSEVTNAGLTYSKESAWNLFLQTVQQNIRWILICSDIGSTFYKWCQQFPSLFNALNVYYLPQWTREILVDHANYHIEDLGMLTKQDKENMCYLLSSMHLSLTNHIKSLENTYSKITNATYENFAQCFRALMKNQYSLIIKQHDLAEQALICIQQKLTSHEKITDDLIHEKTVLEQHKEGTIKILQQIAQDKAVVEQKIHAVHQQLQKIKKFRSLLPEYQVALEKAEYKCSAILENIKDLVQNMDVTALGELRAMQKPDLDIEELMASIIIILKSPNTDLTWAKGAKRQMANLDRFMNELTTFHAAQLPQSTFELLEANIRKIQFTPENMERKAAGNMAAGSLMRWLQGAVQYYRILTSKVKPLQSRVTEMTIALEDAEQKMISLQQRKKALLLRLSDLQRGFEEATMHKNKQQQRTVEIANKLDQAAQVAPLLEDENKKYAAIVSSLPDRLSGIPGSTALAAGLVSYLGAYEHHFRQLMLTVEWPMAVKERGFPLMIDSIDPDKGRVIEFSVIFPNDSPVERQKNSSDTNTLKTQENDEESAWQTADQGEEINASSFLPVITEDLYMDFIRALIMRIVKVDEVQKWSAKDWTPQQMENAAILSFSWQRPALLIDPCFEGETWIQDILGTTSGNPFSYINLQARQDSSVLAPIEKNIISGGPLILNNYCGKWDDLLMPLIDHCCAANDNSSHQDTSSIISFNGHRLLCADHFRLYLAADKLEPSLNTEISCGTTIINYGFSEGSLLDLLLRRVFAKLQPELYRKLMEMANIILDYQKSLKELEKKSRECFISLKLNNMDSDINIIDILKEKKKISYEVEKARLHLNDLLQVRDTLYPIAQQGAVLSSFLKSLRSLSPEYYFTFDFFLKLFDSAIETKDKVKEDVFQLKKETSPEDPPLIIPPSETDQQMDEAVISEKDIEETEDFIVDLPMSDGANTIMVTVDMLTKMAHFTPLKKLPTSKETAQTFITQILKLHGLPSRIISDRGSQFISRFWKTLCDTLQIDHRMSTAYHPQTNGQTERVNQSLEQYLRCYCTHLHDDWSQVLPLAEFAYNNATSSSTQLSPFYANYGFHPKSLPTSSLPSNVPSLEDYLSTLQKTSGILRSNLEAAQEKQKRYYDTRRTAPPTYHVGDMVWLSARNLRLKVPSRKLGRQFVGPFPIEKVINANAVRLTLPPDWKTHPSFHVSLLKPFRPNPFPERRPPPAPPVDIQGEVEFKVERILDSRKRGSSLQYLIRWRGYGAQDDSWGDSADVHAPRLIRVFHRRYPDRPAPAGNPGGVPLRRGSCNATAIDLNDAMPDSKTQLLTSMTYPSTSILSSVQMMNIMDQLTQAVYQVINESSLPEHNTQVCALLFLCIQHLENKNAITEEEIDFFLKGSYTFNEKHLNNTPNPPSWLPYDSWEKIMFLSATSVQLRQLCHKITENASEWGKWYNSDYQNVLSSDAPTNEDNVSRGVFQLPMCADTSSQLDVFHRLLIIRAAHPECFPDAVCQWVKQLSRDLDLQECCQSIESIAVLDQNTIGILVIEPSGMSSTISYSGAILSYKAKQTIAGTAKGGNNLEAEGGEGDIAEQRDMGEEPFSQGSHPAEMDVLAKGLNFAITPRTIPVVDIISATEDSIHSNKVAQALNDTMNQNGWLIIQNLHLASKAMLRNLLKILKYAAKMRVSQKEERQFCVWLTSEHGASIPKDFLAHLKKVSWHFLIMKQDKKKLSLNDGTYMDCLPQLLLSAITSAMDQINEETCSSVKRNPVSVQRLYFGICVLHGVLQTQQIFPKTGLNKLMDVSPVQLHQALNAILSTYERTKACNNNFYDAMAEEVNSIYSGLSLTSVDANYIGALVQEIISATFHEKEFIAINHLIIPIPPADVDPEHYSSWLIDNMQSKNIQKDSFLPSTAEKAAENAYASEFMHTLSVMYDTMQSSQPIITSGSGNTIKQLAYLRTVGEMVLEQLPPLIQIDDVKMSFQETFSNNNRTAPNQQPSTYILLQECNCMNMTLKQIKHNVSALSRCLLGGMTAMPENLRDIANALQRAEVPKSWLPSHSCQTSHNISTWLEGLQKKHKQLNQWVRKGLMPFAKSEKEALTSISVGFLVNPEALLLALRTEFAVNHGYLLHEVVLQCHIKEYPDFKLDSEVYPLYLKGLVLLGAEWDFQKNYLVESRDTFNLLPYVVIFPTLLGNVRQPADGTDFYQCPVFMDYTMQSCVMRLPLLGTKPITQWQLKKVAIILNPEIGFNTSGAFLHVAEKTPRSFPFLNSQTGMDKPSHFRIFNRQSRSKDSFLVQEHGHELAANNDIESFSEKAVIADSLLMETANGSASLQENVTTDVVGEIIVSGNNLASNQNDDKFIKGTVKDGHQMAFAPDENEDGNEMKENLAEGSRFLEFQFDKAAEAVNEPSIREHLMEHTRNTDYELTDNEQDHEDNNGNFDESENRDYKEGLDANCRDNFNKSLRDNIDYEAGEYQASFIHEQENVENNEQEFYYTNSTPDNVAEADDNDVSARGPNVEPFERSEILDADNKMLE